jgi:hypothetical protein
MSGPCIAAKAPLMSESDLVSRASPVQTAIRNCTRDGGGALRGRRSGVDLKPPQAAVVQSNGGERCENASDKHKYDDQVSINGMNSWLKNTDEATIISCSETCLLAFRSGMGRSSEPQSFLCNLVMRERRRCGPSPIKRVQQHRAGEGERSERLTRPSSYETWAANFCCDAQHSPHATVW